MGCARESRASEKEFRAAYGMMLGMSNCLWYGKKVHIEDVKEYAAMITKSITKAAELFEAEAE